MLSEPKLEPDDKKEDWEASKGVYSVLGVSAVLQSAGRVIGLGAEQLVHLLDPHLRKPQQQRCRSDGRGNA